MTLDMFKEDKPGGGGAPPRPLADRMRPKSFEMFLGQGDILGDAKPLKALIDGGAIPSILFWGPPGSGKTTLARLIAKTQDCRFIEISAVSSGVKELREAVATARREWRNNRRRTILFIDEVHRFNKTQQDAILPHVEEGEVIVIGSTTQNPAFEVIPALRSRSRIFRLEKLSFDDVVLIVQRGAEDKEDGFGKRGVKLGEGVVEKIASVSGGDARVALNLLESSVYAAGEGTVDIKMVEDLSRDQAILYDKLGQEHYDHASAFQKSLRGSDPDASIYWLAKMLAGGEDPRFIARRLIVCASEDVGLSDPAALLVAIAAADAVDRIGLPEGRIPLAHATLHIATAPKSNSAYLAINKAMTDIGKGDSHPVPDHLKDTSYKTAKSFGFGKGYKYPHDYAGHYVRQKYLPEKLKAKKYYEPQEEGREKEIKNKMKGKGPG
ncbi:Replication-associated recombination protein RarA [hydrothermal vent metagenome]|uniref:Replication-associated recombination protein RarA n=1 Tax=hydrothermal vent metagenome TaxID=652676 RepID=A0A3B1C5N7_9ZZZZ